MACHCISSPPPSPQKHHSLSLDEPIIINGNVPAATSLYRRRRICREIGEEEVQGDHHQLSVLAAFATIFTKSLVPCQNTSGLEVEQLMEIGSPTNVRHVAHVTFDRFNGFLGLPVEFEPEVPRRPPSASTRVFGVSTESMQLSFDCRGNCVPTILLMMQRRLYSQRGLESEGIFRINPDNGQEEFVREQLNNGLIPDNIDVHCLAGLIKAWFRELPRGVLDALSPEQVMQAQSEDECAQLVRLLPPIEAALLDWAINLMADVAQLENLNKMNARNVAMVFAPNMTQMSDPLTALMYAVQVMNFLKTLIVKTLREREDSIVEAGPMMQLEPWDDDHRRRTILKPNVEDYEGGGGEEARVAKEVGLNQAESKTANESSHGFLNAIEIKLTEHVADHNGPADGIPNSGGGIRGIAEGGGNTSVGNGRNQSRIRRPKTGDQQRNTNHVKKGSRKHTTQPEIHHIDEAVEKGSVIGRVNSYTEGRAEAWR